MDKEQLKDALRGVVRGAYASFSRNAPGDAIVNAAVDAVPDAVDEGFAQYAAEAISSLDRLPANLGRWLSRTVFPQYAAERIAAAGGSECGAPGCQECGGSGWHEVWRSEALPGTAATSIPCICNRIVDSWTHGKPRKYGRKALIDASFTFEAPAPAAGPGRPLSRARYDAKREAAAVDLGHVVPGTDGPQEEMHE